MGSRSSTSFNTHTVVDATAGTGPDGEVPAGTGAAMSGAAASAGAALPDGAAGADRSTGRPQSNRSSQAGRESVRRAPADRELVARNVGRTIGQAPAVPVVIDRAPMGDPTLPPVL